MECDLQLEKKTCAPIKICLKFISIFSTLIFKGLSAKSDSGITTSHFRAGLNWLLANTPFFLDSLLLPGCYGLSV